MKKKLFGTDGIRGRANVYPMTCEMALIIGRALVKILNKKGINQPRILIGKDTRISSDMIENAISSGISSFGAQVIKIGIITTPAISYLTKKFSYDFGIMISASHNPYYDNGIKIFDKLGFKLTDEFEIEIEQEIEKQKKVLIENINLETNKNNSIENNDIGKIIIDQNIISDYIEFAKNTIKIKKLNQLKIAIDCSNGGASYITKKIFQDLKANIIISNNEPNGININENCGSEHLENIKKIVIENKCDIGIAFDGDADRVIIIDENGNEFDGDRILAICSYELKKENKLDKNSIVATIMSNIGLRKYCEKNNINLIETAVGDKYVAKEMKDKGYILGAEQSGHIIFSKYAPTGDGIISSLQVLKIMIKQNKKLSELSKIMTKYPQILTNIKVKEKKDLESIPNLKNKIIEIEKGLNNNGRVLVRYSGTQNILRIMIEGLNIDEIKKYSKELEIIIKKEIGE